MDLAWTYSWEAAYSSYELATVIEADALEDLSLPCKLFAAAARNSVAAELSLATGNAVSTDTGSLVCLVRRLGVLCGTPADGDELADAAMLTRAGLVATLEWGPDFVVRDLFVGRDLAACKTAARRFLDASARTIFGLEFADLAQHRSNLRSQDWDDPEIWADLRRKQREAGR